MWLGRVVTKRFGFTRHCPDAKSLGGIVRPAGSTGSVARVLRALEFVRHTDMLFRVIPLRLAVEKASRAESQFWLTEMGWASKA